jgi:hypothetical protein
MGENQHTVGKETPWRDADTLRELYHEKGMSSREVAEELGCGKKAVLRWLDKHNIEKEKPKSERPPTFQTRPDGAVQIKSQHNNVQYALLHHRLLAVSEWGFDAVSDSVVHHKNRVRWDNRIENLKLLDSQSDHAKLHRGDCPSKLTVEEVKEIRNRREDGESGYKLAEEYGVTDGAIYKAANRINFKWVD